MEGDHCAYDQWARVHFGAAELGDQRRSKRLVQLAAAIRADPQVSLPQQCAGWAPTKGAYRFLSNPNVDPQAMQQPHREHVARQCAQQQRILIVQDTTQADFSRRAQHGSIRGVGKLGTRDNVGMGLLQHSGLAVVPGGGPLGVLYQEMHIQRRTPLAGETREQRRARGTEAEVWQQCALAVAKLPLGQAQVIHVGDRHADVFSFFLTLRQLGHGFVVRANHDRYTQEDTHDASEAAQVQRLRQRVEAQPVVGHRELQVSRQTGSPKKRREARQAKLELRYLSLQLCPPRNDPRWKNEEPIDCRVIDVREVDPPADQEPIHWTLLTSEPVGSVDDAWRVVDWYAQRWIIEEWHRVLKEGCRLEKSQLDDGMDIQRLAMILGPVAADMLALRELADDPQKADDPKALEAHTRPEHIAVAAGKLKLKPEQVTPKKFWKLVARLGGHLGRKSDPRPGWKCLWRGWQQLDLLAQGYRTAIDAMRSG
jgi:hypothetical protein